MARPSRPALSSTSSFKKKYERAAKFGGKGAGSSNSKQEPEDEVIFDFAEREKFLTGFHKRKLERTRLSKEKAVEREREEHKKDMAEIRKDRKIALEEHVATVNAMIAKAQGRDIEESEDESGSDNPSTKKRSSQRPKTVAQLKAKLAAGGSKSKKDKKLAPEPASKKSKILDRESLPPWVSGVETSDESDDGGDGDEPEHYAPSDSDSDSPVGKLGDARSSSGVKHYHDEELDKSTTVTIQDIDITGDRFADSGSDSDSDAREAKAVALAETLEARAAAEAKAAKKEKLKAAKAAAKKKKRRRIPYESKAERAVEKIKRINKKISKQNKKKNT